MATQMTTNGYQFYVLYDFIYFDLKVQPNLESGNRGFYPHLKFPKSGV
jgi:hypothetical protein